MAPTGRGTACALVAAALWAASGLTNTVLAADPPPHELVAEGNKALEKGEAGRAMELYDKAAAQVQDSPEIAYNQGVAYYRASDYDKAAERFSKALSTSDTTLDAKARFNLGNCSYASALKAKDKPKEAIEKLKKASDFFQDVLESHPDDKDARSNLERAQLLIKQLKEENPPESQPQSQPASQPESQPSSQPTSQPESQPQSQPASRPESQPSQGDQKDKDKKQGQGQQGDKKDGQEQQGEQKDAQQKDGDKKDAQQAQGEKKEGEEDKDKQEQAQAVPTTQQAMSKEEVQRLLQMIRDKQRQRMEELERRERGPMRPVDKDW